MSIDKVCIYDRVEITKKRVGTVAFIGFTYFALEPMYGIILDKPLGKNNGTVKNRQYFICKPRCGIFVPRSKILSIISMKFKNFHNRISICDQVMTQLYGIGEVKFIGMLHETENKINYGSSSKSCPNQKYGGIWYGISLTTSLNGKQIKLIQDRNISKPKKRMSGIIKPIDDNNNSNYNHHHSINHSVTGLSINYSKLETISSSTTTASTSTSTTTFKLTHSRLSSKDDYYSWQSFDGKHNDIAYFYCREYQGLFARRQQLTLIQQEKTQRSSKVCLYAMYLIYF